MKEKEKVARPEGFEPPTLCLEGRRSIRLSYGRTFYLQRVASSERSRILSLWILMWVLSLLLGHFGEPTKS